MRPHFPDPDMSRLDRPHALVVDDDTRIRELLGRYLAKNGFLVTEAVDAAMARQLAAMLAFDVIVLDVMMPGEDGLALTQAWKTSGLQTPILLLTARSESEARIAGFEAGADDYLPKPFEPRELVLRLQAIMRRSAAIPRPAIAPTTFGGWSYDATRTMLLRDGETQLLTRAEGMLLSILLGKPGTVFSRQDVAERANLLGQERTIDVQVTRLRRKIEPDSKKPRFLQTIRGEGYVLHVD